MGTIAGRYLRRMKKGLGTMIQKGCVAIEDIR